MTLADPDAEVAAWRATGERVIAACEQQERMIDGLLTLARNDHGLTRSDEAIDLAASGAERTALGNLPQLVLPTPTRAIAIATYQASAAVRAALSECHALSCLAARGGRLHRPENAEVEPREADVRRRAAAFVGHRAAGLPRRGVSI